MYVTLCVYACVCVWDACDGLIHVGMHGHAHPQTHSQTCNLTYTHNIQVGGERKFKALDIKLNEIVQTFFIM